ncbi:MAG: rod shape-determining protein RodA [Gammaproteobacteria bacterium SG8_15]|nr:MAG: rod shape-determining protein RodA [Gammaproteobacteria bacterium SG8_15]
MSLLDVNINEFGERRQGLAESLHLDLPLLMGIVALIVTSLFILYSASGQDMTMIWKQTVRFVVALVIMVALAQVNSNTLKRWTPYIYVIGVLLLVAVLIAGQIGKGAQRWLDFGLFRFQPSEIMKLAIPLMVSWYLSEYPLPPDGKRLAIAMMIIAIPFILIAKQPDLGTSLLVAGAGFFALVFAGLSWKILTGFGILGAASAPVAWYLMHDYQRQRVLTFLDPEQDPLGSGYHIIQSKIAIGSGGLYGKGWLNGTQSQLDFLPERSTDFIFSAYAEEFGFIGVLVLLAIYLFILFRGLLIAVQAQDTFTRLLAGSLTMTFFIYVFVNIGMVTGILPVVGLPLPLVSYGGTSVVTLMASFGILMSIHTHRKFLPR